MKIKVTAKHIRDGVKMDGGKCPIALALRNMGCNSVGAGSSISFRRNSKWIFFKADRRVMNFMDRFDMGKPVKPFTFTL